MRILICRVTIHDCDVQTFPAGGPGGQNQNKRDTAVRVIHRPSGAKGESREERHQMQNKRKAFRRMAETAQFREWARAVGGIETLPPTYAPERVRTYNLVAKRVKDHRTGRTTSDVTGVLDGNLSYFYGV